MTPKKPNETDELALLSKYTAELAAHLNRYKEAAAQAAKEHNFSFNDYLAAQPTDSLRKDAEEFLIVEFGRAASMARTHLIEVRQTLQDVRSLQKELENEHQALRRGKKT